ncbi:T9SS type A sorting domain-containing protein [bacterium]|nr:T9SS type A sorting domain-containing protein [bacterium]
MARVKAMLIAGIFALLPGTVYAQFDWNVQVVDSLSFQNWDWGRGYYGIDLTRVGEELHFSSKLMKDDSFSIVYGTKGLSGWGINTVMDGLCKYQRPTSITFDGEGNPVIFSLDGAGMNSQTLYAAYWDGSDWDISIVGDSITVADAIGASCDNSGKPCCIYLDRKGEYPHPYHYEYSEVKWTGTEWQRDFVISYNDSITRDYCAYTMPSVSVTANAVYMSHGIIIPNGDDPGDTVAIMVYRNGGAGWSLDGKYTDMIYSDYAYLYPFWPYIGTAPDGRTHIWAYNSALSDDPYLIRTETGWEYKGAINVSSGWSAERQELHFSQDSTAFWLTINTNWHQLWVNWRMPDSTYGYSEIPVPWAGHPHTPDLVITSDDTLHILFGFNYGQSAGLCEATAHILDLLTEVEEQTSLTPDAFCLVQNYPNPFNAVTSIQYILPRDGFVQLSIYNITGQLVRTLVSEKERAGTHRVSWNGRDDKAVSVSSGVYFYRLETESSKSMKKMLLLK